MNKALTALLVTIALSWILLPYFGAIFWAVVLGILFAPLIAALFLSNWAILATTKPQVQLP